MDLRTDQLDRRAFLRWAGRGTLGAGVLGGALPALLAACGRDQPAVMTGAPPEAATQGTVLVGDVLDHALTSSDWPGAFGFVTFRLHPAVFEGGEVYLIRTDTSDQSFAESEGLVWAPKLAALRRAGLAGDAYLVDGGSEDQPVVLSSEPGRPDYTPAWRVHRASWNGTPETLTSVAEVEEAAAGGDLSVEDTDIILNGSVVKWSSGELPVDSEAREYLGGGQLLDPVDTESLTARFKLHECFPGVRYIVADVSLEPMAEGMNIAHSPRLSGSSEAGATGRTNVFMNGLKGPGPMGFQPSVFDSQAGEAEWSPYWDHLTYAWKEGVDPRVLPTEEEVHLARDGGELDEFPGTPDTNGEIFTVNCPVPVIAANTFTA